MKKRRCRVEGWRKCWQVRCVHNSGGWCTLGSVSVIWLICHCLHTGRVTSCSQPACTPMHTVGLLVQERPHGLHLLAIGIFLCYQLYQLIMKCWPRPTSSRNVRNYGCVLWYILLTLSESPLSGYEIMLIRMGSLGLWRIPWETFRKS